MIIEEEQGLKERAAYGKYIFKRTIGKINTKIWKRVFIR